MLPISEAVILANSIDPDRYPLRRKTADTIRSAARRGRIRGSKKPYTQWLFNREGLLKWIHDPEAHRPGPKGHSETEG